MRRLGAGRTGTVKSRIAGREWKAAGRRRSGETTAGWHVAIRIVAGPADVGLRSVAGDHQPDDPGDWLVAIPVDPAAQFVPDLIHHLF